MSKEKLLEYLNEVVEYSGEKPVLLKIFKDYKEVFSYKGGFSDEAHTKPADFSNCFYIYSMTKPITCAAAMQLVERGLLDLYAPVSKYLPYFDNIKVREGENIVSKKNDILVWNLFNMSAGFNYERGGKATEEAISKGLSTREVFKEIVREVPFSFHPGDHWQYACRSHEALACIIEAISGKTFYEYLNENIFKPLDMKHIRFNLDDYMSAHMADRFGFDSKKGVYNLIPHVFCLGPTDKYESGGYGLISDINDYEKFANAMANLGMGANGNRILTEESVNLMRKDFLTDKNRDAFWHSGIGYGYGLGVRTRISQIDGSKSPIGEFGWDGAAGGFTLFDPENRLAVVFLTHTMYGNEKLDHMRLRDCIYN